MISSPATRVRGGGIFATCLRTTHSERGGASRRSIAMDFPGRKPEWLTFDCYGTLVQWDEGLLDAIRKILRNHGASPVEPAAFVRVYDRHEHELEQQKPHKPFRTVAAQALQAAMEEFEVPYNASDIEILTTGISK